MQLGIERVLRAGGYGAYSTHFGAIAEDGRFARLPLAAASSLMAQGLRLRRRGRRADRRADVAPATTLLGDTQFTEMYAMDFPRDSILMSHMGEGNWALARDDRPVRLIKRPLGHRRPRRPADVPVPVRDRPGDARHARRRSAATASGCSSSEGEILDTEELPALEMPYGLLPPRHRRAGVHGRLAAPRRPAPPGPQPRPPCARRGGSSASWRAWSSRTSEPMAVVERTARSSAPSGASVVGDRDRRRPGLVVDRRPRAAGHGRRRRARRRLSRQGARPVAEPPA